MRDPHNLLRSLYLVGYLTRLSSGWFRFGGGLVYLLAFGLEMLLAVVYIIQAIHTPPFTMTFFFWKWKGMNLHTESNRFNLKVHYMESSGLKIYANGTKGVWLMVRCQ